ncbi:MAG TPA: Spy/CpxP family protein refolding chaperone [Stellaceae bacterium]|nr:Spy/CpxP family protein refolding chaperone [Stellaceae bacterium]
MMNFGRAALRTLPPVAAALVISVTFALSAIPAAQGQGNPPTSAANRPVQIKVGPDPYVEGEIAFLKAALDVTPAEEAQWDRVAGAMRENNRDTQHLYDKFPSDPTQPQTAVERAELQLESAEVSTQEAKRFVDALRPFYASLSADQKATADKLLGQAPQYAAPPPPNAPPPPAPAPR